MRAFKKKLYAYIRQNTLLLTVLLMMFAAGVIFGSLGVIFLDTAQIKEISYFVERIFTEASTVQVANLFNIINSNLKLMAIIWFLGLTIVGIPLIAAVVFTRGFALGFTSTFLLKTKGAKGIMAIIFALLPPNFFAVPLFLFAAANSIVFSLCLLKSSKKESSLAKNFLAFTISMALIAFLSAGVGALQGFLSPLAMKAVSYTTGR